MLHAFMLTVCWGALSFKPIPVAPPEAQGLFEGKKSSRFFFASKRARKKQESKCF